MSTGHLDVSTRKLEMQAKKLTQPVRWRCLECFEGFQTMKDLEQHLQESGHLSWAAPKRKVAGKAGATGIGDWMFGGRWGDYLKLEHV